MTREQNTERLHLMVPRTMKSDIERASVERGVSEAHLVREALRNAGFGVIAPPFDLLAEAEQLIASAPAMPAHEHRRIVRSLVAPVSRDTLQPRA